MNINELNRIKTINVEEKLAGVKPGSGTFKEILDNVMDGTIIPLTENSGTIIGIHFDTKKESLIEDSIEQRKFEIRYACKPVMGWVHAALKLKADGKVIAEVIESEEEGIKVTTTKGEVIEVEAPKHYEEPEDYDDEDDWDEWELPEEVDIDMDEIEGNVMKGIKKYLRDTYGHYLSGFDGDPIVEEDPEENVYHVSDIHWGRKI